MVKNADRGEAVCGHSFAHDLEETRGEVEEPKCKEPSLFAAEIQLRGTISAAKFCYF
jgi:hypothetical protein